MKKYFDGKVHWKDVSKEHSFNALDLESIENLIFSLEKLKEFGFSSGSSPIVPLIEASVDLVLSLSFQFRNGAREHRSLNPGIKEENFADSLGNSKMTKINFWSRRRASVEIANDLEEIAEWLILIKSKDTTLRNYLGFEEDLSTRKESNKVSLKIFQPRIEKNPNRKKSIEYYVRLRRRKRRQTLNDR